jgi:RHS repeat-associated protein
VYFIEPDHLGTPRLIADENQKTVWRWDNQEPFGNDSPNEDPDGDGVAFDFPLRFPGQYSDRETNLAYNYFRDFDPSIGRYAESDPIGLRGGPNTYVYAMGDAVSGNDPLGLLAELRCNRCGSIGPMTCQVFEDGVQTLTFVTNLGVNATSDVPSDPYGTSGPIPPGRLDVLVGGNTDRFPRDLPAVSNNGRPGELRTPARTDRAGIWFHQGRRSEGCPTLDRQQGLSARQWERKILDLVNRHKNKGGTSMTVREIECGQ